MTTHKTLTAGFAMLLVGLATANSQTASEKKGMQIRVLAVGEAPLTRVEVTSRSIEGISAKEVEVSPDLLPPKKLVLKQSSEKKATSSNEEETVSAAFNISLGTIGQYQRCKGKRKDFSLYRKDETTPFLKAKFAEGTQQGTIVFYKAPQHKKWTKPQALYLSDDLSRFPRRSLRVINTSAWPSAIIVDGQKHIVPSGKVKTIKLGAASTSKTVRYAAAISGSKSKKWTKIANSGFILTEKQRANLVISNRPSDRRRPARCLVFVDLPVAMPAPDRQR